MTENQRQIFQDKHKNISLDKNESSDALIEAARKTLGFLSLRDFPELKTSSGGHDNVTHSQGNNRSVHSNKSWLSVVNRGNEKNFKEAFPTLLSSENNKKKNGSDLISKTDSEKLQSFAGNDNSEKAVAGEEKKAPNLVKSKESKAMLSKKIIIQPQRNPHKKKRSDPAFFNFQDIFIVHKPLKKPKQHNVFKNRWQQHGKEILSGNYLDSSNPMRSRGKHREIKKKKLTKLKLAIIKERIIKKKIKECGFPASVSEHEDFNFIGNLDFKIEIKQYLDELNKKKLVKTENIPKPVSKSIKPGKRNEQTQEIKIIKAVKEEENTVSEFKDERITEMSSGGEIKFSSKFREYCDNILTPALNVAVSELIRDLVKLQDRLFARDPIKAKKKKRHVSGLREVKKYMTLRRVKLVIIAPNLEKLQMEGGVYDSINELKSMAKDQNVPYGFALDRYQLGKCTRKNVPVSAFAVLNYEGIEALFDNTLRHLKAAKESFLELTKSNIKKVEENVEKEDVNAGLITSLISVFREGLQLSKESSQAEFE